MELYLSRLKELLYNQLDHRASAYLYGSAVTGDWISSRSDLDLFLFIPPEKINLLGEKIRIWRSDSKNPILDGFAIFYFDHVLMVKRLDQFDKMAQRASTRTIHLMDLWQIKNRSKHLFGDAFVDSIIPEISIEDLKKWALGELKYIIGLSSSGDLAKVDVVLSGIIWSVSWSARMLMLLEGEVCGSKREALQWLKKEYSEISGLIDLLLESFEKSDDARISMSPEQSLILRKFCLRQMQQKINSSTILDLE